MAQVIGVWLFDPRRWPELQVDADLAEMVDEERFLTPRRVHRDPLHWLGWNVHPSWPS